MFWERMDQRKSSMLGLEVSFAIGSPLSEEDQQFDWFMAQARKLVDQIPPYLT